jgi:glycosyltransferase involved in cell wall biosynthesis
LADAIRRILVDGDVGTSLGRRGRERATRYYDWRNVVSAVNDLFEKAIEERRG